MNGPAIVIDLATMKQLGAASGVSRFSNPFSPDGSLIALSPDWNGRRFDIYDGALGRLHSTLPLRDRVLGQFSDACFVGDSKQLVTTTNIGVPQFWRLRRPPQLWGVVALWQFWFALGALLLLALSYARDLVIWHRGRTIPA